MTSPSPELLRRLNVAAPRYTSYPTVPEWSERFGAGDFARALDEAGRAASEPLSLYVHLPFCRQLCTYCGCNVIVSQDRSRADRYLDVVERELELTAARLGERRRLSRIHWGGGTPTFLDEQQLERLWRAITGRFTVEDGAEVAIEVDPAETTAGQIVRLGALGFNRMSMGVQDFDPDVQRAVERIQSVEETAATVAAARQAGFRSINFDLIYGLPKQTVESFARTMRQVVSLSPDRVAVFSFAFVPEARPNQRKLALVDLPMGQSKLALFEVAQERLTDAGFQSIGFDHFARPDDELARARAEGRLWRDFQGYTTRRAGATIAFGVTGISDLGIAYAQSGRFIGQYERALAGGKHDIVKGIWLGDDDRRRRTIIVDILCNGRAQLGDDADQRFAHELGALRTLADDGLVVFDGTAIELTPLGMTFARNVAMVFDAYLRAPRERRAFSTTI